MTALSIFNADEGGVEALADDVFKRLGANYANAIIDSDDAEVMQSIIDSINADALVIKSTATEFDKEVLGKEKEICGNPELLHDSSAIPYVGLVGNGSYNNRVLWDALNNECSTHSIDAHVDRNYSYIEEADYWEELRLFGFIVEGEFLVAPKVELSTSGGKIFSYTLDGSRYVPDDGGVAFDQAIGLMDNGGTVALYDYADECRQYRYYGDGEVASDEASIDDNIFAYESEYDGWREDSFRFYDDTDTYGENRYVEFNWENEDKAKKEYTWVIMKLPEDFFFDVDSGKGDLFAEAKQWLYIYQSVCELALIIQVICVIVAFVTAVYLCIACGHRPGDNEIHLSWMDKIPLSIISAAVFFIELGGGVLLVEVLQSMRIRYFVPVMVFASELCVALVIIAIEYVLSIVVRLKAHCFWRYTLLYYIVKPIRNFRRDVQENMSIFKKLVLFMVALLVVEFILMIAVSNLGYDAFGFLAFLMVIFDVILPFFLFKVASQWNRVKIGAQNIAEGKLDEQINTEKMIPELKKHAQNINNVGQGIDFAVQDKIKSERFRTELITNVSHDIKTPLTSIINYVDLIKKEDVTDPTLVEYIDVLDRQSARLKKLIEDLMEASKASTGNLSVNLEEFDVSVMLTQMAGEFEEKLKSRDLELVVQHPEESVMIKADGRHLWRVFDNLLNNAFKYSQAGTRVYVNVSNHEDKVQIIFRNTSASMLNISSEELMERFVRGDSSRNTEGSGLGLSIARSLTELMGGTMRLDIDGDLFKVTLTF